MKTKFVRQISKFKICLDFKPISGFVLLSFFATVEKKIVENEEESIDLNELICMN